MVATLLLVGSCGRGDAKKAPRDASLAAELTLTWRPMLTYADRLERSGGSVLGEWDPTMAPDPAPPELRAFETATGEQTRRDRGWILFAAEHVDDAIVVDELATELTYGVRTFGRPASEAVALPQPEAGTWALRGMACGIDPSRCVVVRWAPGGSGRAKVGEPERLALTAVDASSKTVGVTRIIKSLDRYAGTSTVGGVHASADGRSIYLLEWDPADPGADFVRCVSVDTGADRWRTRIPPVPDGDDVVIVQPPDRDRLVVARGDSAFGVLRLADMTTVDAATGVAQRVPNVPVWWSQVILLPDFSGGSIIALRLDVTRLGAGEGRDISFQGVDRFDSKAGTFNRVLDPADGAKSADEVARARRAPTAGLMVGRSHLLLVSAGNSMSAQDTTPPEQQERRREKMESVVRED